MEAVAQKLLARVWSSEFLVKRVIRPLAGTKVSDKNGRINIKYEVRNTKHEIVEYLKLSSPGEQLKIETEVQNSLLNKKRTEANCQGLFSIISSILFLEQVNSKSKVFFFY